MTGIQTANVERRLSHSDGEYVEVLGVQTFYFKYGMGPAIVLIHGGAPGGAAAVNWGRAIIPLADAGFTVYAYDQPGFGYSATPTDHSMNFRVRHAFGFIEALHLDVFHVAGNSQGAYLAASLALEISRIQKLIMISSGTLAPPGGEAAASLAANHVNELRTYTPTLEHMWAMTKKTLFRQELVTEDLVELRFQLSSGQNFKNMLLRQETAPPPPIYNELHRLTGRTLLLGGREDRGVAPEVTLRLLELIPHADLHLFDGCGHWVQWDKTEQFVRMAAEFLADDAT